MFRTLRSKLTFSYLAVALLCLVLAVLGTLTLARSYAQREGFTTLEEKWSLITPLLKATLAVQQRPNPNRPVPRNILTNIDTAIRNANVRVLLLDPNTLQVIEDTTSGNSAVGQQVNFGLADGVLQNQLASPAGVQGTYRFNDEAENVQFVARRLRAADVGGLLGNNPGSATDARNTQLYDVIVAQPQPKLLTGVLGTLRDALFPAIGLALLASLLVAFFLARSISRPVTKLATATVALAKGDYSQRLEVSGQDEIAALTEQFNQMATEIGRAHTVQRDFIANVSHDLKTPLTSIQGFSQAMLDGAIHDEAGYQQAAGIINTESQRMTRLVTELLTLASLESGLVTLALHPADLRDVISKLVLAMQPQAQQSQVELTAHLSSVPTQVLADVDKLQQAFGNLVDNAIKHTPPGGKVTLEMSNIPGGVMVKVIDTGEGIPAADLPRVLERFYQVEKSRALSANAASSRSIGLGLAIAREIVNAHHGGLTIESAQGKGTTILVSLPSEATQHVLDTQNLRRRSTRPLNGHVSDPVPRIGEQTTPAKN